MVEGFPLIVEKIKDMFRVDEDECILLTTLIVNQHRGAPSLSIDHNTGNSKMTSTTQHNAIIGVLIKMFSITMLNKSMSVQIKAWS